jgi:copper chaperone NosL
VTIAKSLCILVLTGLLFGCDEAPSAPPSPQALTDDATGVYCGMILTEHEGPKAQVFEKGRTTPLWFTAVRDALAYSRLPGEAQSIVAFYVHDMGQATSWKKPQTNGIWIQAQNAFYVIGSTKRGGMGMTEVVPFGTKEKADQFALLFGGWVVDYSNIPTDSLFPEPPQSNSALANDKGEGLTQ